MKAKESNLLLEVKIHKRSTTSGWKRFANLPRCWQALRRYKELPSPNNLKLLKANSKLNIILLESQKMWKYLGHISYRYRLWIAIPDTFRIVLSRFNPSLNVIFPLFYESLNSPIVRFLSLEDSVESRIWI